METLIQSYMFTSATESDEEEFTEKLNAIDLDMKTLTFSDLTKIYHAYRDRVCQRGFPKRMSHGYYMAHEALQRMLNIVDCEDMAIAKNKRIDLNLNLYFDLMRAGPGSSHCELMDEIREQKDVRTALEHLENINLRSWVEAFKSLEYTPVPDSTLEDEVHIIQRVVPSHLKTIVGDKTERLNNAEIWVTLLDLHLFCLLSIPRLPSEFTDTMKNCMNAISRPYKDTFYKDCNNSAVVSANIQTLNKFMSENKSPPNKEFYTSAESLLKLMLKTVKSKTIVDIWNDFLELFKCICLHPNASQMKDMISPFQALIEEIDLSVLKSHANLFDTWGRVVAEILNSMTENSEILYVIKWQCSKMVKTVQPANAAEMWFPILKEFLKWPEKYSTYAAKDLIRSNKLTKVWKWKEHVDDAKSLITAITAMPFPECETEEDDKRDLSDVIRNCCDILEDLLKHLQNVKKSGSVQPELSELCMHYIESRNPVTSELAYKGCDLLELGAHKQLIEGLLARMSPLFCSEDFPWEGDFVHAGHELMMTCVNAFENSTEMSPEVHSYLLDMLLYALDDKHEVQDLSSGNASVYNFVVHTSLLVFLIKHRGQSNVSLLKPLFGPILNFLTSNPDEEDLMEAVSAIFSAITQTEPELLSAYVPQMVDLYCSSRNAGYITTIQQSYSHMEDPDILRDSLPQLMEVFLEEKDSYTLQLTFLKTLAVSHPQWFTADIVNSIMKHHFLDSRSTIVTVMVLEVLAESRPELVKPYFQKSILHNSSLMPNLAHAVVKISVYMSQKYEEFESVVVSKFIQMIKTGGDSNQVQIVNGLNGLRELTLIHGVDHIKPHQSIVEKVKEEGNDTVIKDAAGILLDLLEGRSLEKVTQDLEGKKEDIENLNIAVAGTKVVVKKVQKTVHQHDSDIQETKAGLNDVNQRVEVVEQDVDETKQKVEEIDMKTMSNAPTWSRDVTKLMNPESEHDWRLLASRLGYSADDIRGWATQSDPCMALLSEWYATHKTVEASHGVLVALQEMNRLDAAVIVENAMKAVEGVVADEPIDYPEPPEIFLSYQWGHQNEVKLIQRHLEMAGYKCWMDVGQMGGGDKLFEKIDSGIRAAKVIICCVTEKYAKSPNCNREVNLSVNLGKPIIPLLMEKMSWPPKGSMGPIFSEYLFIRFFHRPGEETSDDRIWPIPKFKELLMQLNCLKVMPEESNIAEQYRNWWIPVVEKIVIQKKDVKSGGGGGNTSNEEEKSSDSPEIFISYQWGKQKEISVLYQRMTSLGFTCWMDIHQMGGGDSLYDKIDRGVRGCKVVLSSITQKYALSANCRREVSLADALKKPIIPLLMEKSEWPPAGPMSMVFTQLLFINFCKDESVQMRWDGPKFEELLQQIQVYIPTNNKAITAPIEQKKTDVQDNDKIKNEIPIMKGPDKAAVIQSVAESASKNTSEQARSLQSQVKESQIVGDGIQDVNTADPHSSVDRSLEKSGDKQEESVKKKSSTCCVL